VPWYYEEMFVSHSMHMQSRHGKAWDARLRSIARLPISVEFVVGHFEGAKIEDKKKFIRVYSIGCKRR